MGGDLMPLHMLVGSVVLAKKYLVHSLVQEGVEALKARISSFKDVKAFEDILLAAIAADLQPVRHAALEAARCSNAVRDHYHAGKFRPEVQFELAVVWPASTLTRKRARVA